MFDVSTSPIYSIKQQYSFPFKSIQRIYISNHETIHSSQKFFLTKKEKKERKNTRPPTHLKLGKPPFQPLLLATNRRNSKSKERIRKWISSVCISVYGSNCPRYAKARRNEKGRGDLLIAHCDKLYSLAHLCTERKGIRGRFWEEGEGEKRGENNLGGLEDKIYWARRLEPMFRILEETCTLLLKHRNFGCFRRV